MVYKWFGMIALALLATCFVAAAQEETGTVYTADDVAWQTSAANNYAGDTQHPVLFLNVSADADGHVYVANYWSVLVYDAATGQLEGALQDSSGTIQQYDDAEAVGDGTVWVADTKTYTVYLLDADGTILVSILSTIIDRLGGQMAPNDLALGADGNLYVLYSSADTTIQVYTPAGEFVRSFTLGDNSFSSGVSDFAVGPDGNLYVAGAETVRVLDTEGEIVVEHFAEDFLDANAVALRGIAVDADGNVYVGGNINADVFATDEPLVAAVYKFDAEGNLIGQFGKGQQRIDWGLDFAPEELGFSVALAVLPEGQIAVSDGNSGYSQVFVVDMTG